MFQAAITASALQYNNPQETYNYYYLPFCKPAGAGKAAHKWGGLGEVLEGNQLIDSQLDVRYRCEWWSGTLILFIVRHQSFRGSAWARCWAATNTWACHRAHAACVKKRAAST